MVSIIVPVYNADRYLKKCIDSLISQSYKNIEIILIDDGSTDNSGKICDIYAEFDSRIKVFHTANNGVSCARNYGIDNSSGEYIVFVDADDFLASNYVKVLAESIIKGNCELVVSGILEIIGNKAKPRKIRGELTGNFCEDYFSIIDFLCVTGAKIFLSKIIKENNIKFLTNFSYAEDEIFNFTYYKFVQKYKFIDKNLYFYNRHTDSLSDKSKLRNEENLLNYVRKLELERYFLDMKKINKKEQILGEQGMRAILDFVDLDSYKNFLYQCKLVKSCLYKSFIYNKISKIIFSVLLNYDMWLPLYCLCKLRNSIKYYNLKKGAIL